MAVQPLPIYPGDTRFTPVVDYYCLVTHTSADTPTPFFYCGYFKEHPTEGWQPVISMNPDDALRLYQLADAERIRVNLPTPSNYVVEVHTW